MPRTAAAQQDIRDGRRVQILDAARRVFAWNGLGPTKVSDIAAEAGISQGLVYHYFPNKAALFTAVVEDALRESAEATREALERPGPAWERVERLVERLIDGVLARPESPLVITQAFATRAVPAAARAATEEFGVRTHRDIVALIAQGQAEGTVVAGNPVELSFALTACIQGIALSRLQSHAADAPLPGAATVLRLLDGRG